MEEYRFIYDNRNSKQKFTCPSCGSKNTFVRYIDKLTNQYLPEKFGICDRAIQCKYHLNPYKDGYLRTILSQKKHVITPTSPTLSTSNITCRNESIAESKLIAIPFEILKKTLSGDTINNFAAGLCKRFGNEVTEHQIAKYYFGSLNTPWPKSTTLPFIDSRHKVQAIQIKLFDENLHTVKYEVNNEKKTCTSWIHQTLKFQLEKNNKQIPKWLTDYCSSSPKVSCLFGEHLLNLTENINKPIAIVEAPKTAVIADIYYNKIIEQKNFVWLAAGSLNYLTPLRCKSLTGRRVTLFPDLNAFEKWKLKAKELSSITQFKVSDLLEIKASIEEKKQGLDLADFLLKIPFDSIKGKEVRINTNEIVAVPWETATDNDFEEIKIVWIKLANGNDYDILFDRNGDILNRADKIESVKKIERFFNRNFKPAFCNDVPCWIHLCDK